MTKTAVGGPFWDDDDWAELRRVITQSLGPSAQLGRDMSRIVANSGIREMQEAMEQSLAPIQAVMSQVQASVALMADIPKVSLQGLEKPLVEFGNLSSELGALVTAHRALLDGLPANEAVALDVLGDPQSGDEATSSFEVTLQSLWRAARGGTASAGHELVAVLERYRITLMLVIQMHIIGLVITTQAAGDDPQLVALLEQAERVVGMILIGREALRSLSEDD